MPSGERLDERQQPFAGSCGVDFADNDEMDAATEEAAVSDIKAEGTGASLRLFKSMCRICP
jgi:hypothetical protein